VTGIDGKKNPIEKENVIKVISGMYKGTKATIKNIYKNYVFLYNKDFVNTNGIFCELSENVEILGSELYNENEIGRINKKRIPENLKKLINKTVNIVKGNWKGYKGILKQATDKELLIELSAKQKTVKVNVGDIKEGMDGNNNIVVNNDFGNNNNNNWNTISTPAYNPTTPMSNEWG
jgi:transcription elongation factor